MSMMQKLDDNCVRIKSALGVIYDYLLDDNVLEVIRNSNGSLWLDKFGSGLVDVGDFSDKDTDYLLKQVATYNGTPINDIAPSLEVVLPIGRERFTGLIRVVHGLSFVIRKRAKLIPLEQYVETGVMSEQQFDMINRLIVDVDDGSHKNIGIIGATLSGKSTLANSILRQISILCPQDRMLIIEDTQELTYNSRNVEFFLTSDEFDIDWCLKRSLRFSPNRISVGELRDGQAAWGLLKLLNTGHGGGLFTMHADSCEDALYFRFPQMISEVLQSRQDAVIGKTINTLISIQRDSNNKRKIKELLVVDGFDEKTKKFKIRYSI